MVDGHSPRQRIRSSGSWAACGAQWGGRSRGRWRFRHHPTRGSPRCWTWAAPPPGPGTLPPPPAPPALPPPPPGQHGLQGGTRHTSTTNQLCAKGQSSCPQFQRSCFYRFQSRCLYRVLIVVSVEFRVGASIKFRVVVCVEFRVGVSIEFR